MFFSKAHALYILWTMKPLLLTIVIGLCLSANAEADTYSYTYVGPNFGYGGLEAPYTSADYLQFNLIFDSLLNSPLHQEQSVAPLSWTSSDGVHSLSSDCQDCTASFAFATDTLGNITDWNVRIGNTSGQFGWHSSFYCPTPTCGGDQLDSSTLRLDNGKMAQAESIHNSPIFTPLYWRPPSVVADAVNVPEPSTFAMLLFGIIASVVLLTHAHQHT